MADLEKWERQIQGTLKECFREMRNASATELARSHRFLEAEALLVRRGRLPESSLELDLLARIAAQQGQFEKARRYWKAALQNDPANHDYESLIKAVEQAQKAAAIRRKTGLVSVVAIVLAALGAISVLFWQWKRSIPTKQPNQSIQPSAPRQQTPEPSPLSVKPQTPEPASTAK